MAQESAAVQWRLWSLGPKSVKHKPRLDLANSFYRSSHSLSVTIPCHITITFHLGVELICLELKTMFMHWRRNLSLSLPLAEQMAVILRLITKNTVVNVEPSLSVYLVSPIALFLLTSILPKVSFCDGFIA